MCDIGLHKMQGLINQLQQENFSTKIQLQTVLCQLPDHPKIKICINLTNETTDINNIKLRSEHYTGREYNLQVSLTNLRYNYGKKLYDRIQQELANTIYHVRSVVHSTYDYYNYEVALYLIKWTLN